MNDHLDGFEHRGTGATGVTNMLNGAGYAEISGSWEVSTLNPRTGANAMRMSTLGVTRSVIRRFFRFEGFKKWLGHAWFLPDLPDLSYRWAFAQFVDSANNPIVSFTLSTTGQIEILIGDTASSVGGEVIAAVSDPGAFVPGVYQHVECFAHVNGASSSAEARVNGVVAVSVSGINLGATEIAQWTLGRPRTNSDGVNDCDIDDQRSGDDTGGVNDSFMGDKRVLTDMADGDGAVQQWTPSAGTDAFAMVDEIPPDDDTTYVESATPAEIAQLSFPALIAGVASIHGIAFEAYGRKTDVGVAGFRVNVNSGATQDLGTEQALNLAYEYLPIQNFDSDPDIVGPWTPTTVNAALCELDHSS